MCEAALDCIWQVGARGIQCECVGVSESARSGGEEKRERERACETQWMKTRFNHCVNKQSHLSQQRAPSRKAKQWNTLSDERQGDSIRARTNIFFERKHTLSWTGNTFESRAHWLSLGNVMWRDLRLWLVAKALDCKYVEHLRIQPVRSQSTDSTSWRCARSPHRLRLLVRGELVSPLLPQTQDPNTC